MLSRVNVTLKGEGSLTRSNNHYLVRQRARGAEGGVVVPGASPKGPTVPHVRVGGEEDHELGSEISPSD
jgi:hypothetical protein